MNAKLRSKSKQSLKSTKSKKMTPSTNKSKPKIPINRSQNKIKPFRVESNTIKQDASIKIPKKKKKQP